MSKGRKNHTAFYKFIEPFLENGNNEEIQKARKEYRRKYKASWRNAKRKRDKELTTSWTKEEYRKLKEEAKHHKQSITGFVKGAATAYMNQRFIYPDEIQLRKTIQLLALIYNSILELREVSAISVEATRKMLDDICQLEKDIRVMLYSPKTIEQVLKEELSKHPDNKTQIIAFIQNLVL